MLIELYKDAWGSLLSLLLPANVIYYEELKALVEKGQSLMVVDVRSKEEVDKGRIPGSVHIPGGNILNYFPKEKYNHWWISYSCLITAITRSLSGLILCPVVETCCCHCLFYSVDTVEAAFLLEPEEFKKKYGVAKPQLETQELVFHCQMGRRGGLATEAALKLGYSK